jgi:hypothetical protein
MRALRSIISVTLSDKVKNEVIREEYGVKEDVVTKIKKNMLIWFGHVLLDLLLIEPIRGVWYLT